ncbi:transducin family protein [Diplodia corticola]|uniref:Transducin family protein n=1 Tax=Diplodia corticola TaxID=236234 RepID=A0A1J9RNZ7_9PEZI|nr:transducin family protein [Diplodia corticola]OJD29293.1 transducin family protein [Diplodia corticola]
MSMITATTWVPRGFAAPFPQKYLFDEDEFERISQLARLQLDDAKDDLDAAKNGDKSDEDESPKANAAAIASAKDDIEIDDDLKEYDLDNYDNDEGAVDKDGEPLGIFGNVKSLVYHENNDDDPYITMPDNVDDDVEREDLQILDTDNLVLAARIEDEMAHLEVYVYEDEADNLYVHHDIMLPAIPLTVEWLNTPVGKGPIEENSRGNFVAVGTMDPDIEIWDLDIVDCMYPNAILGQGAEDMANGEKPKKKKKKKSKKANEDYHVDAVLSLAANRTHRNLLASSSADKTVKLWDLNTTKCAKSYTYHTDKVCSLAWHPAETTVLLSGSYDRTVVAADMRAPDAKVPRWGVESDVEQVRWDPHDPNFFYVSTENGVIHYHDARLAPSDPSQTKPIWTLQAHDESISSFDINPVIPGFIATGSTDKEVKLWNVQPSGPSMVVSRNLGVGKVFSTSFAPDKEVGFRLAVAGSKGSVQIWDTSTNAAVRRAFAHRVAPVEGEVKERLVGVQESDSESESDEDEEGKDSDAGPDGWESMDEE